MSTDDITIGCYYSAKIRGRHVTVRVTRKHPNGGYFAENLLTQRTVIVRAGQIAGRVVVPVG